MWQWWSYCCSQVPAGKLPLRVNLDETSICLLQGDCKGTVFISKKRQREESVQRVPRSKRRCCLTHVAFVCDRPELQPLLPQVLVGSERTFLASALAALQRDCPANVRLLRQKSAWNNETLCAAIVRWLGAALRPHLGRFQPILLLDAVRLHITVKVIRACYAAGLWPVVVPAQMTWLLQPLDTDAFRPYKAHLRNAYQEARIKSAAGDLSVSEFMPCVYSAIAHILQGRPWATAFERGGFGDQQAEISQTVRDELRLDGPVHVPALRPTEAQLKCCFPRRSNIPSATIWSPFDRLVAPMVLPRVLACSGGAAGEPCPPAARGAAAAVDARAGPTTGVAELGRTRAETRLREALARGSPLPPPRGRAAARRRLVLL